MSRRCLKVLSLVLAVAFTFTMLLTGCGQAKSTETPTQETTKAADTTAAETTAAQPKLAEYEIQWFMPNGVQPDMEAVNVEMSKITKEKINAALKVEYVDWGSYDQKMQIKMAASEPMDLIFTSNWSNDYITGVNKGAYLEISMDKLKTLAPNVLAGVPEKCWPAAMVKGKLYAIINTQVEGRTPGFVGLKKYFDKYGFDAAKMTKLEDLAPLLEKIKAGEPGVTPFALTNLNNTYNDYALMYGMEVFSKENPAALYINDDSAKVMNYFAAPETKTYLTLVRDWYKKGYIRKDAATIKDDLSDRKAGKEAIVPICVNPDTSANMASMFSAKAPDMASNTFMKTFMGTGGIIATMTAISKTSKDPDRCYMLYNLLYDQNDTKLFNILNYGIEGKHYTKQDDVVTQIPNSGYWIACGWENGCMFNSYRQSTEQPKWYPIGPDMNNTAATSKVLGFSFNPETVKTELAQCASVVSEYYNGLFTGSVDTDKNLSAFLDKLNKAGADKIVAEMQQQIDAWKTTK
jgi:putative aldouronate transport system substrate-binding protein